MNDSRSKRITQIQGRLRELQSQERKLEHGIEQVEVMRKRYGRNQRGFEQAVAHNRRLLGPIQQEMKQLADERLRIEKEL